MIRKEAINELCKLLYSEDLMCNDTQKGRYNKALKIAINSLEIDEQYELLCEQIDFPNTFDVLDKIRAKIERLHYHPKLDFIKNDEVVGMALDIIDKYKTESD